MTVTFRKVKGDTKFGPRPIRDVMHRERWECNRLADRLRVSYLHLYLAITGSAARRCGYGGILGSGYSRETVGSSGPDVIRSWWRQDPEANIGVINGSRSGILIIDLDVKDLTGKQPGDVALQQYMIENGLTLPETTWVSTPSGGGADLAGVG
jgi:hypothetical protein